MIEVRALAGHQEYRRAVELQKIIWGFDDLEVLPVRLFVTAVNAGGQALGAFDAERMIGFCLAVAGVKRAAPAGPYLHSHMLGVLEEYRDSGVGRMLKLAQRKDALERGFQLIEWTFDPFEVKNAYFNIERLGAVVRRFVRNMYGATTSPLHHGLPTDRCVAQWWIASSRVETVLEGTPPSPRVTARIPVPEVRTAASQREMSDAFEKHLGQGLAAVGFEREGVYLMGPWESE